MIADVLAALSKDRNCLVLTNRTSHLESSSSDAWTAGSYRNTANIYQTLVARWNGPAWQQAASPNTAVSQHKILNSVAATSASNAWTVGFTASASTGTGYQTLILHWNGTDWTYMTSP